MWKILQTIDAHTMLKKEDSVLVGVSGGPDSIALLHVLKTLAPRFALRLGVAHINHSLRGAASDADAEFVRALAADLGVPFYFHQVDTLHLMRTTGACLEEAARDARYAFFEELHKTSPFGKLALGHHKDDNAELIMMNLLRGSGARGIAGIPPTRNSGRIIRPLIAVSRAGIEAYLSGNGYEYREDASNRDMRFLRNRIRHRLLPQLAADYNPRIVENLNQLGCILAAEDKWAEQCVQSLLDKYLETDSRDRIRISVQVLQTHSRAAGRRLVRALIKRLTDHLRRIRFGHVEDVLGLSAATARGMLHLPNGIIVERRNEWLVFIKTSAKGRPSLPDAGMDRQSDFSMSLFAEGFKPGQVDVTQIGGCIRFSVVLPNSGAQSAAPGHIALMDMDCIAFPLILRSVRPGDRFRPLGMSGHQKISRYLVNRKVPKQYRHLYPVLESRGRIIWLAGHRIDDAVKTTRRTKRILQVEWVLADG